MAVKCSRCGKPAVAEIRYARSRLCREHLIEFIERRFRKGNEEFKVFKNIRRIVAAVSGGKDSLAMLYLLHRFSSVYGYEIIGLTIDLGIDRGKEYSRKSVEAAVESFKKLDIEYVVVDLSREYGYTIDFIRDRGRRLGIRRPVCSVCGITKRYIMNRFALELGADAVATGHNLNDLAQFIFTNMYGGHIDELIKMYPKLPGGNGFTAKIKPVFMLYEKETTLYSILNNIRFHHDTCPHLENGIGGRFQTAIREKLEQLEEEFPGFMLNYVLTYMRRIRPLMVSGSSMGGDGDGDSGEKISVGRCRICGMPSLRDVCAFCSIRSRVSLKVSETISRSRGD